MRCPHEVVAGLGMYGDALTCVLCGRSKYPKVFGHYKLMLPKTKKNLERANTAIEQRRKR